VSKKFIPILQKALKKSPDYRYQTAQEILGDLKKLDYFILESIEQCLKQGRKHVKGPNWTAADRAFRQGLELCQWSDESTDLESQLEEGHLFVRGKLCMTKEDWNASVEAFKDLSKRHSHYLGHDIPNLLQQSQSEQQYLHKYYLALQLLKEEQWTAVLRQTEGMRSDFTGADGDKSIGDIQKQALYFQAQELLTDNPKRAYHLLYRIWEQDAHYKDVAKLCADLAYQSSKLVNTLNEFNDRVTWLEKTINIDPDYQNGYAQVELNKARYEWAVQLSNSENEQKAIEQFERITDLDKFPTARPILANLYEKQGDKAIGKLHIFKAVRYWSRCLYNHCKLSKPY
jgi:tetratricopeptide (TPR) repeat protein